MSDDAKNWLEQAIGHARGDSYRHLADLDPKSRDIAELGARRAIAYLVDHEWIKDEILQQNQ